MSQLPVRCDETRPPAEIAGMELGVKMRAMRRIFAHDCEMRLFELAYCCRIYGETTGYDEALARFVGGTGGAVDLDDPRHRALTLQWLRAWGCRSLRAEDDKRSSRALKAWWAKWHAALPAVEVTLSTLEDDVLDAAADAYADLASRIGPRRQLPDRLIDIQFGPTTAAKAMFAIRPNAFVPWDNAIRKKLGYKTDAASYRHALARARDELREAVRDTDIAPADLPRLIGRPDSTPPKLVDEHDWVRYTAGHEPPTRDELAKWLSWA